MKVGNILLIAAVIVVLGLVGYVGYIAWAMPKPNEYLDNRVTREKKLSKLFFSVVKLLLYPLGSWYVERELRRELPNLRLTID